MDNITKNLPSHKIDIIIAVAGGICDIQDCIDSWFPIHPEYNLHIYNSAVSDIDGTTEYLFEKQKNYNFNLINEGEVLSHTKAIERLIPQTTSDWILHLDSDIKIIDRRFFDLLLENIQNETNKVWGKIDKFRFVPAFDETPTGFRMFLPRLCAWAILFNKKFMFENHFSFSATTFKLKENLGEHIPLSSKLKKVEGDQEYYIRGEPSWQLYWGAVNQDVLGIFSNEIWECFEHKLGASRKWKKRNTNKIQELVNISKKSQ